MTSTIKHHDAPLSWFALNEQDKQANLADHTRGRDCSRCSTRGRPLADGGVSGSMIPVAAVKPIAWLPASHPSLALGKPMPVDLTPVVLSVTFVAVWAMAGEILVRKRR